MLGTIADQAGDASEAVRRYKLAYDTIPAATASVALASRLFRSGAVEDAAAVLRTFDSAPPPPDPWELYGQRDFRSFAVFRHEMRKAVAGVMMRPLPAELPAVPGTAPLTLTSSRAATNYVRVPVLVHSDGEPVPDLKAADFSLSDSGVLQDITSVESDTRALDLTVVAQETTQTKSGKYQALDTEISALAKALTPADRLTVMLSGRDPRPFTPPGTRNLVQESELQRRCQPVYDTLSRALMQPPSPDRQRVVILMTGGEGRGGFLIHRSHRRDRPPGERETLRRQTRNEPAFQQPHCRGRLPGSQYGLQQGTRGPAPVRRGRRPEQGNPNARERPDQTSCRHRRVYRRAGDPGSAVS